MPPSDAGLRATLARSLLAGGVIENHDPEKAEEAAIIALAEVRAAEMMPLPTARLLELVDLLRAHLEAADGFTGAHRQSGEPHATDTLAAADRCRKAEQALAAALVDTAPQLLAEVCSARVAHLLDEEEPVDDHELARRNGEAGLCEGLAL